MRCRDRNAAEESVRNHPAGFSSPLGYLGSRWRRSSSPWTNLRPSAWLISRDSTTSRQRCGWTYHARPSAESLRRLEARSLECWLKDWLCASKEVQSKWPKDELLGVINASISGVCRTEPADRRPALSARATTSLTPKRNEGWGGLGKDADAMRPASPSEASGQSA